MFLVYVNKLARMMLRRYWNGVVVVVGAVDVMVVDIVLPVRPFLRRSVSDPVAECPSHPPFPWWYWLWWWWKNRGFDGGG